jgi:hypothetical protein
MKVIYVGGSCDFCEGFRERYPANHNSDETHLTKGRHYTVIEQWMVQAPWATGVGYRLAEYTLPPNWGHCSCGFREIEGDAEAWRRLVRENHPKIKDKELEPA